MSSDESLQRSIVDPGGWHIDEWPFAGPHRPIQARAINCTSRILAERLSGQAVCIVVRERVAVAGYEPYESSAYSGHSLRAGLATSAAQAKVSTLKIRKQRARQRKRCFRLTWA